MFDDMCLVFTVVRYFVLLCVSWYIYSVSCSHIVLWLFVSLIILSIIYN